MAKKAKNSLDFRVYQSSREENTSLLSATTNMTGALKARINILNKLFANEGTSSRIRRKTAEQLALDYGVETILPASGYKSKHLRRIMLAPIFDQRDTPKSFFVNLEAYPSLIAMFEDLATILQKLPGDVRIQINSAFRSNATQERLYKKYIAWQQNPALPKAAIAAKPGTSNHQMGLALDIQQFQVKKKSGEEDQLQNILSKLSPKYGWYRTVESEPWHFAYGMRNPVLIAGSDGEDVAIAIQSVATFLARPLIATERTALDGLLATADAASRAVSITKASRAEMYSHASTMTSFISAGPVTEASLTEVALASVDNAAEYIPPPFDGKSPYTFDFTTGLWGDGKVGGKVVDG